MTASDRRREGGAPTRTATPPRSNRTSSGRPRVEIRRFPRLVTQAVKLVWEAAPRRLLWSAVLQVIGGLSLAGQLLVLKRLLDALLVDGTTDLASFGLDLALFVVLVVVAAAATLTTAEQQRLIGELVERHTTGKVMEVATSVDLLEYDRPAFYDRLERAQVNANARPVQMTAGLLGLANGAVAIIAVGGTLIWLEPLVLAILLAGSVPTLWLNRVAARAFHAYTVEFTPADRRRAYLYRILCRKEEAHEIRAFDSAEFLRRDYDRLYGEKIDALRRVARRRLLLGLAGAMISAVTVAATLTLLLVLVSTGAMGLAAAGTAVGAVMLLSTRLRAVVGSTASLYEGSLFLEDFIDFLNDYPPVTRESDGGTQGAKGLRPPVTTIELDDVSFTYPSRSTPSLQNITTSIRRGEVIALVGENGSGKTTLAKILAGLFEPSRGTVRWDSLDVRTLGGATVREDVAVIFQDFARYWLSANDNVGIGAPAHAQDRPRARRAATRAGAHGFLSDLPNGYDELLGPSFVLGSDLSGGQWQRIALARAYFRDAPVLILDEPTASLDPRGEYEVFEQVRRLAAGRTVVLISHRFSNARLADRILVLDQGRLVEDGPHETLMGHGGLYAELFTMQAAGFGVVARPGVPAS